MPGLFTIDAQPGGDSRHLGIALHRPGPFRQKAFQASEPEGSPPSSQSAVAQLGGGLEGHEERAVSQDRLVLLSSETEALIQFGADDARVDHDGAGRNGRAHVSAKASQNNRDSSSVRSSITYSPPPLQGLGSRLTASSASLGE